MKRRKTSRIYVMQWDTGNFECFEERFMNEWFVKYCEGLYDNVKKAVYFDDDGIYHKVI